MARARALPSIGLIVLGWLIAWFGRHPFAAWLLRHTGKTTVIGPSSPHALDYRLLELGLAFGFVLALPLFWWQACALIAPSTIGRARALFTTYLYFSFGLLLALLMLAIVAVQRTPQGLVDLGVLQGNIYSVPTEPFEVDPFFAMSIHVDEYVLIHGLALLLSALLASLVTPIFVLARFHPASSHERCLTLLWASGGGCGLFLVFLVLSEMIFPAMHSGFVASAMSALGAPPVVLRLRRRAAERETRLSGVALAVGASVLLLAQNWFLVRTGLLGLVVLAAYWSSAALGLWLRRATGEARSS